MDNSGINPIKQNLSIKQYIGWFIVIFIPFAIKGIMDVTGLPLLTASIYWCVCGIFLRYVMNRRLPYFKPRFGKIKKEVIAFSIFTILGVYFYINGYTKNDPFTNKVLINTFLIVLLNGCFEQLVWVNIFDLAGARIKLNGFFAAYIYIMLMNILFWNKFIPMPANNISLFIILQILLIAFPFIMYMKTDDITIWSIQHIIYNVLIIVLSKMGGGLFFL